ncbi:helix-turn-helix domain-containing protein [Serinibacter arcticus]|uniref:helix-turn-helix domain-containing protein n=1 Tax=Serinibacter arcticus TaxID=1655435 RepID=UPI001F270E70|nr:helix-turn-helix domain-containing protein [Serinibacter arcticus]
MNPLVARSGARVREVRTSRGLSLSALAEAAGIGKGSLSELENGVRNPTLATLYALAAPLQVPLATLLADTPGATLDGDGVAVRLLDTRRSAVDVREVYLLDLAPDAVREATGHGAGVVEHVLVTAGDLEVGRSEATATVTSGGSHSWTSDAAHVYRAGPAGAAAVLTIVTPA